MPRDKIDAAIKRGTGNSDADNFVTVRYEGYGPGGVAIIVQALTDNRNRTAPEMRSSFTKFGGNLGETGSVSFMFDYAGVIIYPKSAGSEDDILEVAIESGADNCESDAESHIVTTSVEAFLNTREALAAKFGAALSAKLSWVPKMTSAVNEEQGTQILKLIEMLEDNDDVQEVFSNVELPEQLVEKLSA